MLSLVVLLLWLRRGSPRSCEFGYVIYTRTNGSPYIISSLLQLGEKNPNSYFSGNKLNNITLSPDKVSLYSTPIQRQDYVLTPTKDFNMPSGVSSFTIGNQSYLIGTYTDLMSSIGTATLFMNNDNISWPCNLSS